MIVFLSMLWTAQAAEPREVRHPCEAIEDLDPDRYSRKSMVIFPVEIPDSAWGTDAVRYNGTLPEGRAADDRQLLESVSQGLLATDYPLLRFDAWMTNLAPVIEDGQLTANGPRVKRALLCADVAVVPRIAQYTMEEETVEKEKGSYPTFNVKMVWELDIYRRSGDALRLDQTLSARVPRIVDMTEDVMNTARAGSVDQLMEMAPIDGQTAQRAERGVRIVISQLPDEQAEQINNTIEQTQLAVTRVASVARPITVLQVLDGGPNPANSGLSWRSRENQCYINPPEPEDTNYRQRAMACAQLNRTRQGIRDLVLQTRKVPDFRLYASVSIDEGRDASFAIGREEGLQVGDGYWLYASGDKVGYARVRALGDGGDSALPSGMEVVFSTSDAATVATLRGTENPQLGIEIGPWLGRLPARRPDATLPDDPISGGDRALSAGQGALGGSLRFDVNLGRMTERYEVYQTNRLLFSRAGELGHTRAAFGAEKRLLVAPRLYAYGGAALGFQSWRIPSGEVYTDDEGNTREISASARRIGPELDAGFIVMVSPSIMLRTMLGLNASGSIDEFSWSRDDREGTVVPEPIDGDSFKLGTTGLMAGAATTWVF
ncbi:MAG: hypothetical protein ACI8S6_002539 [Myxococcota bacterium]|jgi:hypothetical protein